MKKKKIILHLLQSNQFSGAENVVLQIMEMFKTENVEMFYCCPKGEIENILKERNMNYILLKKPSILEVRKAIKICKPDIIHAHDYTMSTLASISKPTRVKLYAHLHNNAEWIKKINIKTIGFLCASIRISKILIVSTSIKKEYKFNKVLYQKFYHIGNPINKYHILENNNYNSFKKKYDLIYLGRINHAKNPELFIEIIYELKKKIPNLKCVIVGRGDLEEKIQKMVIQKNLIDNVKIMGFIENPYKIILQSRILCLTSRWEGYGLVAAEALILKTPVVCSNVGGLPEIVDNECGKLCNCKDDFISEILKLLSSKEYYNIKVKNAEIKLNELHNQEEYKLKLEWLYDKVG